MAALGVASGSSIFYQELESIAEGCFSFLSGETGPLPGGPTACFGL